MLEIAIYEILRKIAFDNEFKIAFVFDFCTNFDIVDGFLVLTFDKQFFKTFKNNILINKNDILKIKTKESYYYENRIEFFSYEIKESILYDSNNVHITILENTFNYCLDSLKVLSEMIYNNYNFKGLSFNDKKLINKIGHFNCRKNIQKNDILKRIDNEKNYYSNDLVIDLKGNDSLIAYDSFIIDEYNSKEYYQNSFRYFSTYYYEIDYNQLMKYLFFNFKKFESKRQNFKTIIYKDSIFIYFKGNAIFSFKIESNMFESFIRFNIYAKGLKKFNAFELLEKYISISLLKEIDSIEKIRFHIS